MFLVILFTKNIDNYWVKWYIINCQPGIGNGWRYLLIINGRLAQLVRALALQARGHRFESYNAHHFFADLA